MVDLGKVLGYDQRSLFHFVRTLVELNLWCVEQRNLVACGPGLTCSRSVKFRATQQKTWTNRIIHRRYLDTSIEWQAHTATDEDAGGEADMDVDADEADAPPTTSNGQPKMTPISRLHIDSCPDLVRKRLLTLLRNSPNHMHLHESAILAVGVQGVDVRLRRLFNRIVIDKLISAGQIEKVGVPHPQHGQTLILYLALREDAEDEQDERNTDAGAAAAADEEAFAPTLLANLPVDHQIMDMLISAGEEGMTNRVRRAVSALTWR